METSCPGRAIYVSQSASRSLGCHIGQSLFFLAAIGGMSVSKVQKNKLLPKTQSPADTSFFLWSIHISHMHIICTLHAHYMHIVWTLYAHYMHMICTSYAHYMHIICTLYAHCDAIYAVHAIYWWVKINFQSSATKNQQHGHPEEDVLLSQALEPFQLLVTHWVNGEHPLGYGRQIIGKIMVIHGNWDHPWKLGCTIFKQIQ